MYSRPSSAAMRRACTPPWPASTLAFIASFTLSMRRLRTRRPVSAHAVTSTNTSQAPLEQWDQARDSCPACPRRRFSTGCQAASGARGLIALQKGVWAQGGRAAARTS